MIDLRSDTVTKPSKEMRQAIAAAPVGDDVYSEDPTVNLLQEKVADFFGKEAALYVPSGTMSNQIALKILTQPGDEIVTEADAHIYYYETAAPAILSQVQIRPIPSAMGMPLLSEFENVIRPDLYYFPRTSLFCLENTHNRHGGTILPIEEFPKVKQLADKNNIRMHLDGARIWNAIVETGISGAEYARYFDTLSVCLSKGMGAPVGSLLVSTRENIQKAIKWRKIFGGGMRQAGLLAAGGLFALENNLEKLAFDHANAKLAAQKISEIDGITVDLARTQTNMVRFDLGRISPAEFVSECSKAGLLLSATGGKTIRIVFHLDIDRTQTLKAIEIIATVCR